MIMLYIFLVIVYFAIGMFLIGIYEDADWFDILYAAWFVFWPLCLVFRYLAMFLKLFYKAGDRTIRKFYERKWRK